MCCAATPGIFPTLSLSLTLARKLLHALSLLSFLSQSPRQCRATAARRPASGVAIIRQGPRSGRAVAEAADEGRQRPGGDARLGGDISGRDGEDRACGLARRIPM